jgi:hypothetical protein
LFCDIKYSLPSAIFFIKVPSLNPNLPATFIEDSADSAALTVGKDQDAVALSDINLNLLPSLIQ